jgi:hypothetical protein
VPVESPREAQHAGRARRFRRRGSGSARRLFRAAGRPRRTLGKKGTPSFSTWQSSVRCFLPIDGGLQAPGSPRRTWRRLDWWCRSRRGGARHDRRLRASGLQVRRLARKGSVEVGSIDRDWELRGLPVPAAGEARLRVEARELDLDAVLAHCADGPRSKEGLVRPFEAQGTDDDRVPLVRFDDAPIPSRVEA